VLLDKAHVAQVAVGGTIRLGNRGDAIILANSGGRSIDQGGLGSERIFSMECRG
jgi:hypothetical protein